MALPRARGSKALGVAAVFGLAAGSLGLALTPALADPRPEVAPGATVATPFGQAPISFADIIAKVKPSVVSVSVANGTKVANRSNPGTPGNPGGGNRRMPEGFPEIPEDHPLYDLFKNLPKNLQPEQRPSQAQGSGFVISADGYVVTNNHVIDGATKIEVSFDDQERIEAELIGSDPRTDLALLKIKSNGKTYPFVKFATKQSRVGDWALAVGNPFGLGGTVTAGIVSALGRDIGSGPYDFLQIDAAVNKGNSGGPTFNLDGDVLGVNTAIFSPSGGNVGIAFAVPAVTAVDVVEQLKKSGTVSRGWLGVKIQNVDADTASAIGLADQKGALVSEVTPAGPAAGSGIKVQDTILQVNGDKIADSRDLARKIAEYAPNTEVDVKVWRDNGEHSLKIKLGKFPGSSDELAKLEGREGGAKPEEPDRGTALEMLGLRLAPVRDGGGVSIMEVDPDSNAAEKGLKVGDIILQVGGTPVAAPADVTEGVKKARDLGRNAVMLQVKTSDQTRSVAVVLKKS